MMLDNSAALAAVQRLYGLPQTKHVFVLSGRHRKYVLVWVLQNGARHHLSTDEQVLYALST
jgi:hypothetical protein